MKIISKYRDYYDYLTGIYGIDEKLILDRRDYGNIQFYPSIIKLYIAGYIVEGLCLDGKFYYGKDLNQFICKHEMGRIWLSKHYKRDYDKSIEIEYFDPKIHHEWIYIEPVIDNEILNKEHDCPILLVNHWNDKVICKYPILDKMNLASFIPAETIYKWLTEWLSNQISNKEISKPMTNDEKIVAKGFDKKRSFRPNIKL